MDEQLKELRSRLRLSMNGVVSTSMREQGIVYKLNFGVSLPKIKEIAADFNKNAAFAERIWSEDVRELKIIATLLYPQEQFLPEQAERWVRDIRHQEIAEQFSANLLQHLPYAHQLAALWISCEEEFTQVTGFLLYTRLFARGYMAGKAEAILLLEEARRIMDAGISRKQCAAILALKRYGRQNKKQAQEVLHQLSDYSQSVSPEQQEFYNDLYFEFEYYH